MKKLIKLRLVGAIVVSLAGGSVAIAGYYSVASGLYDMVLAIGFEQQSCGNTTVGLASVGLGEFTIFSDLGYTIERMRSNMGGGAAIGERR